MKKILNNKVYDTKTAKLLGESSFGRYGDFNYWIEELYQKKTGEFFLYGEGGANTRYGRQTATNTWSGGSAITPLTYETAQKWAEEHLTGDEYEAIFGKIEEDENTVRRFFTMRADSLEKLKRAASRRGVTMSELFEEFISSLEE